METPKNCPHCGKPLGAHSVEGLCPDCLLQAGMGTRTPGMTTAARRFVPPAPAELQKLFPQLEILGLLGQGGMGAVYKARQPALDRLVALKILPMETANEPGFAERFTREARALAKLNHPNIVAVHDFGRSAGGFPYFVMEYVDGANLRSIEQAGKLAPREALGIIPQICAALQYAHDAGIVHRDIKPENILVDKEGRVKIADFGIAKVFGRDATGAPFTAGPEVLGTPHYMAPEQVERPRQVDHRADIYSLGVVFYEMLTGELPLGRFSVPSRKAATDPRLDEVVMRTLEKEPHERYQHASQVKTDVERIAETSAREQAAPPLNLAAALAQVKWPAKLLRFYGLVIFAQLVAGLAWRWARVGQAYWQTRDAAAAAIAERAPADWWGLSQRLAGAPPPWAATALTVGLIVLAGLIMRGAIGMQRLERYGRAITASLLAMAWGIMGFNLPLSLPTAGNAAMLFGFLLILAGLPAGLWALAVLVRPEVVAAFAGVKQKSTNPGEGAGPPVDRFFTDARMGTLAAVFAMTFLVIVAGFALYGLNKTPEYVSTATVQQLLAPPDGLFDSGRQAPRMLTPEEFNVSVRLMESSTLVNAVAERLTEDERRRFLAPFENHFGETPLSLPQRLLAGRTVAPLRLSYMTAISFKHPDKEVAAIIANDFAQALIDYIKGMNADASIKSVEDLNDQVNRQRKKVEEIQARLAELAKQNPTAVMSSGNNIFAAAMLQESQIVNENRRALDALEGQWQQLQEMKRASKPLWEMPRIAQDPLVSDLLKKYSNLKVELASMAPQYSASHPRVMDLTAQKQEVEDQLKQAADAAERMLSADCERAQRNYDEAKQRMEVMLAENKDASTLLVEYNALQRDLDVTSTIYKQIETTKQQEMAKFALITPTFRIVDKAGISPEPAEPNLPFLLVMGVGAGVAGGFVMVLLAGVVMAIRRRGESA